MNEIICPFCQETDFDVIGLKNHLLSGHCKIFDETISIEQERHLTNSSSRAAKVCVCRSGGWFDFKDVCINCGGTRLPSA